MNDPQLIEINETEALILEETQEALLDLMLRERPITLEEHKLVYVLTRHLLKLEGFLKVAA